MFIAWLGFRGNWNIFHRIAFYRYFPVTWRFGYYFFGISTCSVGKIKELRETGIKSLSGPFSVIENKRVKITTYQRNRKRGNEIYSKEGGVDFSGR